MDEGEVDAALLARIAAGDPAAARIMVRSKLPRVVALATRLLQDRGEAEDVAQESFMRVWRHAGRWRDGEARFDTWLHTVVLNLCRDRMRRRATRPPATDAVGVDLADPAPGAEVALLAAERERRVAAAIAALPERQREALVLVHYQDKGGAEAAEIMEVSVEALESLLARGRRTLRAGFAAERFGD